MKNRKKSNFHRKILFVLVLIFVVFTGNSHAVGNLPPVAKAGADKTIWIGDTVLFDGSPSFSPNGSITNYEWSNGLIGATVSQSFYTIGIHTIDLTVTNDQGAQATDSVQVTVLDDPTLFLRGTLLPEGWNQADSTNQLVKSENGYNVFLPVNAGSYEIQISDEYWTQHHTFGRNERLAELTQGYGYNLGNGTDPIAVTFAEDGFYQFRFSFSDGTPHLVVSKNPLKGQPMYLLGDLVATQWEIPQVLEVIANNGTEVEQVSYAGGATQSNHFVTDANDTYALELELEAGTYQFQLLLQSWAGNVIWGQHQVDSVTVNDIESVAVAMDGAPMSLTVPEAAKYRFSTHLDNSLTPILTIQALPPTPPSFNLFSHIGATEPLKTMDLYYLDGSASYDLNSSPLSYQWTMDAAPTGSTAELSSSTDVIPYFIADKAGDYSFTLKVSNEAGETAETSVHLTATKHTITVHYHRQNANYNGWEIEFSGDGVSEVGNIARALFIKTEEPTFVPIMLNSILVPVFLDNVSSLEDSFGKYVSFDILDPNAMLTFGIVRGGEKDIPEARFIYPSSNSEIWLVEADPSVYFEEPPLNGDIGMPPITSLNSSRTSRSMERSSSLGCAPTNYSRQSHDTITHRHEEEWNLVSFPVLETQYSLTKFLEHDPLSVKRVWSWNELSSEWEVGPETFAPEHPYRLNTIEPNKAYWVFFGGCGVPFTGSVEHGPLDIELHTGWQMVGYNFPYAISAQSVIDQYVNPAFAEGSEESITIWVWDPATAWKVLSSSDSTNTFWIENLNYYTPDLVLKPGQGFWIEIQGSPRTLNFPKMKPYPEDLYVWSYNGTWQRGEQLVEAPQGKYEAIWEVNAGSQMIRVGNFTGDFYLGSDVAITGENPGKTITVGTTHPLIEQGGYVGFNTNGGYLSVSLNPLDPERPQFTVQEFELTPTVAHLDSLGNTIELQGTESFEKGIIPPNYNAPPPGFTMISDDFYRVIPPANYLGEGKISISPVDTVDRVMIYNETYEDFELIPFAKDSEGNIQVRIPPSQVGLQFALLKANDVSNKFRRTFAQTDGNPRNFAIQHFPHEEKARISVDFDWYTSEGVKCYQRTVDADLNVFDSEPCSAGTMVVSGNTLELNGSGTYQIRLYNGTQIAYWSQTVYVKPVADSRAPASVVSALANDYLPFAVFDKEEPYFPMGIADMLEFSTSVDDTYEITRPDSSIVLKPGVEVQEYLLYNGHNSSLISFDWWSKVCTGIPATECNPTFLRKATRDSGVQYKPTLYYDFIVEGNKGYLSYYFFYPFDPQYAEGSDPAEKPQIAAHTYDHESFSIEFNYNGNTSSWEPQDLVFGAHLSEQAVSLLVTGDGEKPSSIEEAVSWKTAGVKVSWDQALKFNGHPVIYKAAGSHAILPLQGWYQVDAKPDLSQFNFLSAVEPAGRGEDKTVYPRQWTVKSMDLNAGDSTALNFSGAWIDSTFVDSFFPPFLAKNMTPEWFAQAQRAFDPASCPDTFDGGALCASDKIKLGNMLDMDGNFKTYKEVNDGGAILQKFHIPGLDVLEETLFVGTSITLGGQNHQPQALNADAPKIVVGDQIATKQSSFLSLHCQESVVDRGSLNLTFDEEALVSILKTPSCFSSPSKTIAAPTDPAKVKIYHTIAEDMSMGRMSRPQSMVVLPFQGIDYISSLDGNVQIHWEAVDGSGIPGFDPLKLEYHIFASPFSGVNVSRSTWVGSVTSSEISFITNVQAPWYYKVQAVYDGVMGSNNREERPYILSNLTPKVYIGDFHQIHGSVSGSSQYTLLEAPVGASVPLNEVYNLSSGDTLNFTADRLGQYVFEVLVFDTENRLVAHEDMTLTSMAPSTTLSLSSEENGTVDMSSIVDIFYTMNPNDSRYIIKPKVDRPGDFSAALINESGGGYNFQGDAEGRFDVTLQLYYNEQLLQEDVQSFSVSCSADRTPWKPELEENILRLNTEVKIFPSTHTATYSYDYLETGEAAFQAIEYELIESDGKYYCAPQRATTVYETNSIKAAGDLDYGEAICQKVALPISEPKEYSFLSEVSTFPGASNDLLDVLGQGEWNSLYIEGPSVPKPGGYLLRDLKKADEPWPVLPYEGVACGGNYSTSYQQNSVPVLRACYKSDDSLFGSCE